MSDKSAIEWTDATWNPITGCTKVSAGCDNCYAERFAERWRGIKGHHFEQGFDLTVFGDRFEIPLRWKKPRRIFVNSMSDLFHGEIDKHVVFKLLNLMAKADWHIYQILTKRPARMKRLIKEWRPDRATPSHMWFGVSIEDEISADSRIPDLMEINSRSRFLSVEPLLETISLRGYLKTGKIHWCIVGGESGPKARKLEKGSVELIWSECYDYGVPFFFKQWGGITAKSGGRMFRGRVWDGMPPEMENYAS